MNGSKQTQQIPIPRWIEAESKQHVNQRLKRQNKTTEAQYHAILKAVKEQFMPLRPETAFERDYKKHPDNAGIATHLFMTKGFSWYLSCGACSEFNLDYSFDNCPFEAEVKALMETFPPNYYVNEYKCQPDLPTTFKRLGRLEDSDYFTTAW